MYILDTNTLIYFFKNNGNVAEKLLSVSPQKIAIPSIVLYELEYGIAKSNTPQKRQAQLNELCAVVNVLPFDDVAAKTSAIIRAKLEQQGTPIGHYDVLIAGIALAHQDILVTHNTKEFARISELKLEDWY
jgi:tRNA(fMet)-specific endonuclease VapC